MPDDYQPVSCRLYDELGLRMLRGTSSVLVIDTEEGTETIETVIRDVFSEGDAEYVRLDDGTRIRLDRIRRVDDAPSPDAH
jgi:transcriptional antiterminator Rof (Rho-off)